MSDDSLSLPEIISLINQFVKERDWETFHTPQALALSAAIEVGELLEKFQWLTSTEIEEQLSNPQYREGLADEIADVLIYLLRLSTVTMIDPEKAILSKLKKNAIKYPREIWKGKIPDKVRNP